MAIQAISGLKSSGHVNFEGRKKDKAPVSVPAANTIKAIPLAVLVAMSPLANAQNNNRVFWGPKDKIIASYDWSDTDKGTQIHLVSVDGDDTPDKVYLTKRELVKEYEYSGDALKKICYLQDSRVHVDSLIQKVRGTLYVDPSGKKESIPVIDTLYVVRGLGETVSGESRDAVSGKYYGPGINTGLKSTEIEVSKKLFDELNYIYEGEVPVVKKNIDGGIKDLSEYYLTL